MIPEGTVLKKGMDVRSDVASGRTFEIVKVTNLKVTLRATGIDLNATFTESRRKVMSVCSLI